MLTYFSNTRRYIPTETSRNCPESPICRSTIIVKLIFTDRARRRVENDALNMLKNREYNVEHNFGHGNYYFSTIMPYVMTIVFLIGSIRRP